MNSSLLELKEALVYLTDYNQNWSFDMTSSADANGLAKAYQVANAISNAFSGVNSSLEEGWATTADLYYKLFQMVQDNFGQMYEDIDKFTEQALAAEEGAKTAVDEANSAAKDILTELGLDPKSSAGGGKHDF